MQMGNFPMLFTILKLKMSGGMSYTACIRAYKYTADDRETGKSRTRWKSRFDEICHGFPVIGLYYIMYTILLVPAWEGFNYMDG